MINKNYPFQQLSHPKLKVRVKLIVVVTLPLLVEIVLRVMVNIGVMEIASGLKKNVIIHQVMSNDIKFHISWVLNFI